jgi:hypothetical protein
MLSCYNSGNYSELTAFTVDTNGCVGDIFVRLIWSFTQTWNAKNLNYVPIQPWKVSLSYKFNALRQYKVYLIHLIITINSVLRICYIFQLLSVGVRAGSIPKICILVIIENFCLWTYTYEYITIEYKNLPTLKNMETYQVCAMCSRCTVTSFINVNVWNAVTWFSI